jgi:hypothetical protein
MTRTELFIWLAMLGATLGLFVSSTTMLGVRNQEHHFWYGVYGVAIGASFIILGAGTWAIWLVRLGLFVMADDSTQHAVQLVRPSYRSPLHLLYRYAIYNPTHT